MHTCVYDTKGKQSTILFDFTLPCSITKTIDLSYNLFENTAHQKETLDIARGGLLENLLP